MQGLYASWKPLNFRSLISRPWKYLNFVFGPWKSLIFYWARSQNCNNLCFSFPVLSLVSLTHVHLATRAQRMSGLHAFLGFEVKLSLKKSLKFLSRVSWKVLEKSLNILLEKMYEPCGISLGLMGHLAHNADFTNLSIIHTFQMV